MGFFQKIKTGLEKTRSSMVKNIEGMLNSFTKIDEELFEELEEILISGDVGVATAAKVRTKLREKVKETGAASSEEVKVLLKSILTEMMSGGEELNLSTKPSIILVIGVNGVGKTTTIGKMAADLKRRGKRVLLAAADTFRAAAIEQLAIWAERAGAEMVHHAEGADPAAVVFDSITAGKARGMDVIICDTAGRLHNKKNLMEELSKISRVIEREAPECSKEVLLVLDATTGQNAINQARQFKEAAGLTGIVLTKLDGTARGGVVIAIKEELGLPIKYIGVGEQIDDLQPFNATDFIEALFNGAEPKRVHKDE
ncbi:MAG: signal recognition particle-docking protein FtsY [Hydrogenoanaerobacterium sp.]